MVTTYHYRQFDIIRAMFFTPENYHLFMEWQKSTGHRFYQPKEGYSLKDGAPGGSFLPIALKGESDPPLLVGTPPELGAMNRNKYGPFPMAVRELWGHHPGGDAVTIVLYALEDNNHTNFFVKRTGEDEYGFKEVTAYEETHIPYWPIDDRGTYNRFLKTHAAESPWGFLTLKEMLDTTDPDVIAFRQPLFKEWFKESSFRFKGKHKDIVGL